MTVPVKAAAAWSGRDDAAPPDAADASMPRLVADSRVPVAGSARRRRALLPALALSAGGHLAIALLLGLAWSMQQGQQRSAPSVMEVRLVVRAAPPAQQAAEPLAEPPPPAPVPTPPPPKPERPQTQIAKAERAAPKPTPPPKPAPSQPEKREAPVRQQAASSVVAEKKAQPQGEPEPDSPLQSLLQRVHDNWLEPPHTRRNFLCRVKIDFLAGGRIQSVTLERGCGDPQLDDSVIRAVWKSQPLQLGAAGTQAGSLVLDFRP